MPSPKMVKCRYCGTDVQTGTRHHCQQMRAAHQSARMADEDDDSFFVSLAVAAATDNWALGVLAGGNLMGAMVGDALVDDEPERFNDGGDSDDSGSSFESDSFGDSGFDD